MIVGAAPTMFKAILQQIWHYIVDSMNWHQTGGNPQLKCKKVTKQQIGPHSEDSEWWQGKSVSFS